jgi:hypothetical protein
MILIFSRDPCSYCEDGCEVERADDDVVSGQPGRPAASTGPTRQLLALLSLPSPPFWSKGYIGRLALSMTRFVKKMEMHMEVGDFMCH